MNIIAKQLERSNVVFAFREGAIQPPEPSRIFSLYGGDASKGSLFSDNPAMSTRVFEFPALGLMWIFEGSRVRVEDKRFRSPQDSKLPQEMLRVLKALYPNVAPIAQGFNYDILYRMDIVIPVADIMGSFLRKEAVENIADFGWQYTLTKEKGKRAETYFFKVVSPIEFSVHANYHFNNIGTVEERDLQKSFEHSYREVDKALDHIAFKS